MSQIQTSHPPRSQDTPRRQVWNTNNSLCIGDDDTCVDVVKEITFLWNEWADSTELLLHGMINQLEDLVVSYADYIYLSRRLASYPARPAAESQDPSDETLSDVWNNWADAVEIIFHDLKRTVERGVPLPSKEEMLCASERVDSRLVLLSQGPPPTHMAAILRKMLRNRARARNELADAMGTLRI